MTYTVTGDPSPDCTTETTGESAGDYDGYPYWTWVASGVTWYLFWRMYQYAIGDSMPSPGMLWLGGGTPEQIAFTPTGWVTGSPVVIVPSGQTSYVAISAAGKHIVLERQA